MFSRFLIFMLALMLLCTITAPAQVIPDPVCLGYGEHDIDINLAYNEIRVYVVKLDAGDSMEVELLVETGGPVDFYLMDNYTAYLTSQSNPDLLAGAGDLYFLEEGKYSKSSTYSISFKYRASFDDTMILLVDNSGLTAGGAQPSGEAGVIGTITVTESMWTFQNIVITIILVIAIIAVFLGFRLPKKKN